MLAWGSWHAWVSAALGQQCSQKYPQKAFLRVRWHCKTFWYISPKESPTTTFLWFGANCFGCYGFFPCLHFWLKGLIAAVMDGYPGSIPPAVIALRRQFLTNLELGGGLVAKWAFFVIRLARRFLVTARFIYSRDIYLWLRGYTWALQVEASFRFLTDPETELDSEADDSEADDF